MLLKKFLGIWFLSLFLSYNSHMAFALNFQPAYNLVTKILDESSTPRGIVIIAIANSFIGGIANFIWAFNWELHANVSSDMSARLQEAGGLMASGQCFILGAGATYLFYRYNKQRTASQTTETQELEGIGVKDQ